jgi:hypothetical protein
MTPERIVKILARHHEIITVQQAKRMLEMVNLLAGIAVISILEIPKVSFFYNC